MYNVFQQCKCTETRTLRERTTTRATWYAGIAVFEAIDVRPSSAADKVRCAVKYRREMAQCAKDRVYMSDAITGTTKGENERHRKHIGLRVCLEAMMFTHEAALVKNSPESCVHRQCK